MPPFGAAVLSTRPLVSPGVHSRRDVRAARSALLTMRTGEFRSLDERARNAPNVYDDEVRSAKALCFSAAPMACRRALICLASVGMKVSSDNFELKSLASGLAVISASRESTTDVHRAASSTSEWSSDACGAKAIVWESQCLPRIVSMVVAAIAMKNDLNRKFRIYAS